MIRSLPLLSGAVLAILTLGAAANSARCKVPRLSLSRPAAVQNAGKRGSDIGYVIHDANSAQPGSSDRLASLTQTLTGELVEFDFLKQTFNTSALLGEMGAGTALTNVAPGIAYANHVGKHVLVAGTNDAAQPTAVVVTRPAKVRPLDPNVPWFRARGGNTAHLPWWGLRHDAKPQSQGFSR